MYQFKHNPWFLTYCGVTPVERKCLEVLLSSKTIQQTANTVGLSRSRVSNCLTRARHRMKRYGLNHPEWLPWYAAYELEIQRVLKKGNE